MSIELEREKLSAFAERERESYEGLLREFVEIPTVSSEPERRPDIARGVELAAETIRRFGGRAEVLQTEGNPILYGAFDAAEGLPTATVYNHMDVQPASREAEPWETDPFVMTRRGDTYFGRGTTDDKGPALAALFGLRAAREAGVEMNVRLLWEFEEEIGSPNFEQGIARAAERLATDCVVVSDTVWVSRERPANPSSLRGLLGLRFVLETGTTDQHSGNVGGAARNPLGELMQVVTDIYDPATGEVKIPGFYDEVVQPTAEELEDYARSGFTAEGFKADHLLKSLRTDDPVEIMRRIWALPTFELHGVVGGYAGPGVKSIVPPRAEVKASCRLVSPQEPEKVFRLVESFVKERNPDVEVLRAGTSRPYKGRTTGPLVEAIKRSMGFAFGTEPVFIGGGGTIGAVPTMERVLRCPVVFMGLSLPEHGYHAPNENFDWGQASGGIVAFARLFEELSRTNPRG